MASRYPTSFHMDFCYSPVRISKNGRTFYVPCGKCNGCRLQKSNSLSQRLGDDIESSSHAIFTTLTYDNIHVPKMNSRKEGKEYHYFSAPGNLRFNGRCDVPREPIDFYSPYFLYAPLKNYHDPDCIGYLCKSDIQLYFKLLRKSVYDRFNISSGAFRYFCCAEYGPGKDPRQGKYRPHYHLVIIPCNSEVASYLLQTALFACWQMSDRNLFNDYTVYCDSGTRHYVTEYVNSITSLPSLLQQTKEIKPFTLYSKQSGPVGTLQFDYQKVSQEIERGVDEYYRRVPRIERNYIFLYPSQVTNTLFPKCSRYSLLSFNGLLRVYEYLYNFRSVGYEVSSVFYGLDDFRIQDYAASKACLKVCDLNGWTPYHYVEVLVSFYYRKAMRALRYQYEFQQDHIHDPYVCFAWYYNTEDFLKPELMSNFLDYRYRYHTDAQLSFYNSFGVHDSYEDLCVKLQAIRSQKDYVSEVDDICFNADKSKKVNSLVGLSPHIV